MKIMGTIRQKINQVLLSKDDRLLQRYEVCSDHGHLTDVGRRVVLDILFEDKNLRAQVIERIRAVEADEKDSKK